jgi:hypothetical protein
LRVPTGVTMACCSEGPNWSYHGMLLWVDRGVHAKFHATYVGGSPVTQWLKKSILICLLNLNLSPLLR